MKKTPSDVINAAERFGERRAKAADAVWSNHVHPCATEWFTTAPTPRPWLLTDSRARDAGVLPAGKTGLLIGEGGVSKTMALVALVIAVATGTKWLGCYSVARPGRVLAILGEEDLDEVRRRCFHAARATKSPVPAPDAIVVMPLSGVPCAMVEKTERGNPVDAAFLLWLRGEIEARGPFALIVVDPLSRFAGPDAEIDNAAATRFVQALESIATATGATVLVAHHTNKTARANGAAVTGASARGSSAILDGVRWAASLSAERLDMGSGDDQMFGDLGELVTLSIVKSNYSLKSEPVLLRRDGENGGALLPLDDVEKQIVVNTRAASDPKVQQAKQGRTAIEDAADLIVQILQKGPSLSYRGLLAEVGAIRRIGRPGFDAALALLGAKVGTAQGPRGSTLYSLA